MSDFITDKFLVEIDKEMSADENYKNITMSLNEFLEKEFSQEKANQIGEMIGRLISAVESASAAAGIKLGAKIAAALFSE
ncbi:MAG: hypothetical protein NC093_07015 [Alistipes sp.]|nr:hypothetical protein [Alistipes sp.]